MLIINVMVALSSFIIKNASIMPAGGSIGFSMATWGFLMSQMKNSSFSVKRFSAQFQSCKRFGLSMKWALAAASINSYMVSWQGILTKLTLEKCMKYPIVKNGTELVPMVIPYTFSQSAVVFTIHVNDKEKMPSVYLSALEYKQLQYRI